MTDYFSRALGSSRDDPSVELTQGASPAAPAPDYFGRIVGGGTPKAEAPADKELNYDYDRTLGFKQQAVGSFASDDAEWLRFAAKSLYPEEPIDRSVKRFGKTKEGRYFHRGDDEKLYEVTPPKGMARLANIGGGVGHALPVGGATVGGVASAPLAVTGVGLLGTMGIAGAGGAVGEVARQKIGDWILPEGVADNALSLPNVAYEGAQSMLGQGVGAGFGAMLSRYAVPDIGRYSAPAANALMDKADKIGVRVTPAEATGLESLIGDQKRLAGTSQSANVMKDFARERNAEVYDAYKGFLNQLGQPRDAAALAREGGTTADEIFRTTQKARTAAVNPFYTQAEREIGPVDTSGVLKFIEQELPTAKGSVRTALEKARGFMMETGTDNPDTTFRGLDNAKQAIDGILRDKSFATAQGLDRTAMAKLQEIRDRLVTSIESTASNSGAYKQGRDLYAQQTKDIVKPAQEALDPLLAISRREGTPGGSTNITGVAQSLLDPKNRSPEQIKQAKALIEKQDPALWNSFVRQFMQEETTNVLRTMAGGEMRNVGGGIQKALSSEPMMDNLRAAMSPKQFKEFSDIVDVFRATARAFDGNSDTAFKTEALKRAKNQAGGAIARTVRNINPAKALDNVADWFANRNFDRQAEALAHIITSGDRQAIMRLRQLRNLPDNDWRRLSVMGEVLVRGGAVAADEYLGD